MIPEVQIKLLRPTSKMPVYMTEGAAALDVFADIDDHLVIGARETPVPLGFALAIPRGWCARIVGRSGNSRDGITARSGLIDSDYRGEVSALVCASQWVTGAGVDEGRHVTGVPHSWACGRIVHAGDRIAQMYFTLAPRATLRSVAELPPTARGEGGWGSTGKR